MTAKVQCSFGKNQKEVRNVQAPNVSICEVCVELPSDILARGKDKQNG